MTDQTIEQPNGHTNGQPNGQTSDPPNGQASIARAAGLMVVATGLAVALDGLVGGAAMVVVAAVLLARFPARILGGLGVVALLAVPLVVVLGGIPTEDEVSPAFVTRSLVPHHLTFVGLVLLAAWVLLDVAPHLVRDADAPKPTGEPAQEISPRRRAVALATVTLVAIGAVAASLAVLQA